MNILDKVSGVHHGDDHINDNKKITFITYLATPTISSREVTALAHELRYHPVEGTTLEMQYLSRSSNALFASTELSEILCGLWHYICPQFHLDAALGRSAYGDVEEDYGIFGTHIFDVHLVCSALAGR